MKTMLRSMMIVCMLAAMLTIAPAPVSAQVDGGGGSMPAGLQEAILSSTTKPFQEGGGRYLASTGGLKFELSVNGLQAGGEGLQWGISLQGIGRGTEIQEVTPPKVKQMGGRLEYQRGVLTEWYRDTAIGVEQGFTISEPPKGNGKLVLHLDLSGDVEGRLSEDGRGLSFPGSDGQTLRYDQLKAYDANGVELDAKLIFEPGKVQILVNDRGAEYPITIDPLIYLEQSVIATDGAADDLFGYSVALSGDTALVGAYGDDVGANNSQGSAYVFVRSGTTWTRQAKLTASDGAANDYFGNSVALSGDTAVVGAENDEVGANTVQGSAYVFVRSGTTWTQQAQLTASDGTGYDNFGYSVALSGDTAVVGAYHDDVVANTNQGSAYVFVRSGTTWTQQAQLAVSDGAANDAFGSSVALFGDTALVGARIDDVVANTNQGSAYVFVRSGTTWTQEQMLTASDGAANDLFGNSVALSGDTALVGAYYDDVGANGTQGSAYVFVRNGTTWTEQAQLTASDGAANDYFGISVALSGDTALVGAFYDTVGSNDAQGSAYIFVRSGTTWTQQTQLTASDGAANDAFGSSIAISGDTVLVGADQDTVGANYAQGSVYFYQAYRTDADLAVSAVRGVGGPLHTGDTVFLTTSVMNYGPQTATSVMINVSLPSGLTYVSHAVKQGTYTPSLNLWSVGSLGMGVGATLTIEATVDSIPSQTLVFAPYSLARDTNDSNNTASLSLPVYTTHEIAKNGGFNTYVGTSKIPQNWVAVNFATTDGKITTIKKEGTASVKIAGAAGKTKTLTQTLTLGGRAGDEFAFSFWAKGVTIPVAGLCRAQVMLYNGVTLKLTKTVNCTNGTYGFAKKILNFTATSAYTKIVIKLTYAKATGTIYFDGLSLLKAP